MLLCGLRPDLRVRAKAARLRGLYLRNWYLKRKGLPRKRVRAREVSRSAQGRIPGKALFRPSAPTGPPIIRGTTLLRPSMTTVALFALYAGLRSPILVVTSRRRTGSSTCHCPSKGLSAFHDDGSGGVFAVPPTHRFSIATRAPCEGVSGYSSPSTPSMKN